MRNAETTLAIIEDRGKRGQPLEDVYRQLYNPDLYLRAYGRLYRNAGAMTKGTTEETVDPTFRTSRAEYLRISVGALNPGQCVVGPPHLQEPEDLALQPAQLRREDHGGSAAR